MNPFDLAGPDFLVFYAALSVILLSGLYFLSRIDGEPSTGGALDTTDPYLIGHLRSGPGEAVRVAIVSLIDRGLLLAEDSTVQTTREDAPDLVQRPIERAILEHFSTPMLVASAGTSGQVLTTTAAYERRLVDAGLLSSPQRRRALRLRAWFVAAVLVGVAITKIVIAVERGRTNILFLVLLALLDLAVVSAVGPRPRTRRGDARLADLQRLFGGLRDRAGALQPGGSTNEMALLAAAFGIGVLPIQFAPAVAPYEKQRLGGFGSWDSGGSDGGGGGGSCGGSCGGGCGGCGG